ncbi:myosin heavy chain, cardiac muscle beta isoform, putative [Perkinsus marinus ATCC 50983]|uniref:Myosin heavy chain, cardiac muscle beta isoform, putative n=1 Tax=Perkinsus marinus (strain ATCC 50983 / TXsc) TaxID=423536 RepID=C5KZV0_PERM5|nr:myosin heavy chain, cardiac muscle beta isoform, putative [Perkinsus marinus ATCC 50983]EER09808.1 myosin heavy chain, cardiac muscle beta isoform, putative [Perkinsus marinus ATCC 50983]|eukprot:XP_002778013.1 myosin heavy chain, cardiac muscle beta isoform, putative [Perkinsus marinus ATCC 50983]
MVASVQKMWEDLCKDNDELKRQLQTKLAEADGRNTAVQEMITREREQHTDDFAQERKKWTERVVELETMLEEAKQSLEDTQYRFQRETAQMRDQESVMRDQVKQLQDRLQERSSSKSSSSKGATGAELNNLRDAVYGALSELKSLDLDKKQLSVKAEHEKQLIGLERKFNKQLNEARRKNEMLIEHLRQTYEEEVDTLKSQRSELQQTVKEFEKQLAMRTAECDKLRSMVASAETDRKLRQQHADVLVNQSELIISFLRGLGHGDGPQIGVKLEKLSTQAQDLFGVTVRRT